MPSIVTTTNAKRKKGVQLPIVVGAVVVAAVALFLIFPVKTPEPSVPQESSNTPQTHIIPLDTNAVSPTSEDVLELEADAEPVALTPINSSKIIRPSQKTHTPTNNVLKARGCGVIRVAESNVISRTPAQFSTKTEKFLSAYIKSSQHPTMIFPSMSPEMEADCIKALQTDIVVYEDDPEEIQAHKEAVAALKQDLLKALEEGYSVTDCLNEMRKVNNNNVRERSRMQHQLNHLLQDGDAEAAVKYFNEANARLDECGLPHILYLEDRYFGKGRRHKNGETDGENKESDPEAGQTL